MCRSEWSNGKPHHTTVDSCEELPHGKYESPLTEEQVGFPDAVKQYLYQLACCKPEERFRIANTSPTPSNMRANELGSGVATGAPQANCPVCPMSLSENLDVT